MAKVKEIIRCPKCDRETATFDTHHKTARMDGGTDEPENLIRLCHVCHTEWHSFEERYKLPFQDWLLLPSGHDLALKIHVWKSELFKPENQDLSDEILFKEFYLLIFGS